MGDISTQEDRRLTDSRAMNLGQRQPRNRGGPKDRILLGDHQIKLPAGLTVTDWTIEKVRWQNPRIRTFPRLH